MPIYEYRNKLTGEIFTEYLPIKDRKKPLKDKNIELLNNTPRNATTNRKKNKTRDNTNY